MGLEEKLPSGILLDAILKLHDKIQNMKLGANREAEVTELEQAGLRRLPSAVKVSGQRVAWGTEEYDGPTA